MDPFARGAVTALVSACLLPGLLAGAQELTEEEAIRIFLESHPAVRTGPLAAASVEAGQRADALAPNPSVSWIVEDAAGVRDEFVLLEQELPINGRRSLLKERAENAASSARLEAEDELMNLGHSVRLAFHEALYRERALETLRYGIALLDRTLAVLQERERLGESSGYDVLRARQDTFDLQARAAAAESDAAAARASIRSYLGSEAGARPLASGSAASSREPLPSSEEAAAFALSHRRDLQAAEARARQHEIEERAGTRRKIPDPVIGGGLKRVELAGESDSGFVASLSVPLPLFDRGQLDVARARADGERAAAEIEVLRRRIEAEVDAALVRARTSREAAERVGRRTEEDAAQLETMARVAYEEGDQGILVLLDAYRASLQSRLRSQELAFEAKRAEIELDRVMGREVAP